MSFYFKRSKKVQFSRRKKEGFRLKTVLRSCFSLSLPWACKSQWKPITADFIAMYTPGFSDVIRRS